MQGHKQVRFDGTGNYKDAFVEQSADYDNISIQQPQINRMNYQNDIPIRSISDYDLPPDSEYHHFDSTVLRQFSGFYSHYNIPEHAPDLLISQDISKLLNLSIKTQVFDVKGQEKPEYANNLQITRIKQLGSGSQGEVFLSKAKLGGKEFTCVAKIRKVLNNDKLSQQVFENMFREFEIGRQLRHPSIIKNLFYVRRKNDANEQENAILLELMAGGNVQEYMDTLPNNKIEDINTLRSIVKQIVEAVVYLHKTKIVHQDLKPENILLAADLKTIKLCDFGVSN